ncbi:MAG: polysaccharide ABC transporter ATP-binding protein [Chloroflexota bacterium]
MSLEPIIEFTNVSKRFSVTVGNPRSVLEGVIAILRRQPPATETAENDLWALRDLDFQVMQGQCLGLIGRNGSGKSTALKLIARILKPTTGRITVRGRVGALLELGAGFHHDLTGRENIYLNAAVLGLSRTDIEACYDSIVSFSELGDFVDTPVKHYSSGMFMRLGFSIAVHIEPDILIVDEILAVGDQAFQKKCVNRISELQANGTTILIVSHNARTVRDICTHLVWLDQGRMRARGTMEEVLPEYVAHYEREKANHPMLRKRSRQIETTDIPELTLTVSALRNQHCQETAIFSMGDSLSTTIHYQQVAPLENPYLELSVYRNDDVLVHRIGRQLPRAPQTDEVTGSLSITFDTLPILPGAYRLETVVYDQFQLLAQRENGFQIQEDEHSNQSGVVMIPTEWKQLTS